MRQRGVLALGFWIVLALVGSQARAAHLEKTQWDISTTAQPDPKLPISDPCSASTSGSGTFNLAPDGHSLLLSVDLGTAVRGLSPDCNANTQATATANAAFLIAADPGETVGDPITFCAQESDAESASAISPYTATAAFGNELLNGPASLIINPSGTPVTIVSEGLRVVINNGQDGGGVSRQFTAFIGDQLQVRFGVQVQASGTGIGSAQASSSGTIQFAMRSCDLPAPVASHRGIIVLASVLGALGLLSLWRPSRRATDTPRV